MLSRGKPAAAPLRRRLGGRERGRGLRCECGVHGMGKSAGSLQGRGFDDFDGIWSLFVFFADLKR